MHSLTSLDIDGEHLCSFLHCHAPDKDNLESKLNRIVVSFRTSFWTEEKRWLVICNIFATRGEAEIFTSPICISYYKHIADREQIKTISNFKREDQHSTVLKTVNELTINMSVILLDDRVSIHLHHSGTLLSDDHMWLNSNCSITEKLVLYLDCRPFRHIQRFVPVRFFSSIVDLSQVTQLSLDFSDLLSFDRIHNVSGNHRLCHDINEELFKSGKSTLRVGLVGWEIKYQQWSQTHEIVSLTMRFFISLSLATFLHSWSQIGRT